MRRGTRTVLTIHITKHHMKSRYRCTSISYSSSDSILCSIVKYWNLWIRRTTEHTHSRRIRKLHRTSLPTVQSEPYRYRSGFTSTAGRGWVDLIIEIESWNWRDRTVAAALMLTYLITPSKKQCRNRLVRAMFYYLSHVLLTSSLIWVDRGIRNLSRNTRRKSNWRFHYYRLSKIILGSHWYTCIYIRK